MPIQHWKACDHTYLMVFIELNYLKHIETIDNILKKMQVIQIRCTKTPLPHFIADNLVCSCLTQWAINTGCTGRSWWRDNASKTQAQRSTAFNLSINNTLSIITFVKKIIFVAIIIHYLSFMLYTHFIFVLQSINLILVPKDILSSNLARLRPSHLYKCLVR